MNEAENLSHTKWQCKCHVVFIPKCHRKTLYRQLKRYLGEVFRGLAAQKESRIEEGHLIPDHVHMTTSIPPKYAVSQLVGSTSERARFTWPACTGSASGTSWGSTSGHWGTSYPRWGATRR